MKSKFIYIVGASSGDYEDYRTWNVVAFLDKNQAEKFKTKCQKIYDSLLEKYNSKLRKWQENDYEGDTPKFGKSKLDTNPNMDSNQVTYCIEKIKLKK